MQFHQLQQRNDEFIGRSQPLSSSRIKINWIQVSSFHSAVKTIFLAPTRIFPSWTRNFRELALHRTTSTFALLLRNVGNAGWKLHVPIGRTIREIRDNIFTGYGGLRVTLPVLTGSSLFVLLRTDTFVRTRHPISSRPTRTTCNGVEPFSNERLLTSLRYVKFVRHIHACKRARMLEFRTVVSLPFINRCNFNKHS